MQTKVYMRLLELN